MERIDEREEGGLSGPVPPAERAVVLDALRGFALLGIFALNLTVFSGYVFLNDIQRDALPLPWLNQAADALIQLLIHDKFYSLFALLFGIGVAIQYERAGAAFLARHYRRMAALLGIGLVHLLVLWYGDILTCYALVGLLLPLFLNRSSRVILASAALLALTPVALAVAMTATHGAANISTPLEGVSLHLFNTYVKSGVISAFRSSADLGVIQANAALAAGRFATILGEDRLPLILSMFLLGLWAGQRRLYRLFPEDYRLLRRVRSWGFGIGLPLNGLLLLRSALGGVSSEVEVPFALASAVGVPALCLAYAATVALLWVHPRFRPALALLAPAGRLSLTNYLAQSFIGVTLFYGVGFAQIGAAGSAACILIAFALFTLQVLWSRAWLAAFHLGPAEWLWRSLTYGNLQPFRRQKPVAEEAHAVSG